MNKGSEPLPTSSESAGPSADSTVIYSPEEIVTRWMAEVEAIPPADTLARNWAALCLRNQIVSAYGLGDKNGVLSDRDTVQVDNRVTLLAGLAAEDTPTEQLALAENFAYDLAHLVWKEAAAENRAHDLHLSATYDKLTGLRNRSGMAEVLPGMIEAAEHGEIQLAMLFLDIDSFKQANDTFGHTFGDHLLQGVASILHGRTRKPEGGRNGDVVVRPRKKDEIEDPESQNVRLGGDEFVMLVALNKINSAHPARAESTEGVADVAGRVEGIAERFTKEIGEYLARESAAMRPDGSPLPGLGVSIGYVLWEPGMTAEELMDRADNHMYAIKERRHEEAIHEAAERLGGLVVELPGMHDL